MTKSRVILVTGGAGFIGCNFIRYVYSHRPGWFVVNLDALTCAGNPMNLSDLEAEAGERYRFVRGDIRLDEPSLSFIPPGRRPYRPEAGN